MIVHQNYTKMISKRRMIARNGILDPIEFWWVPLMLQMVVPKSSRGQGGPDEAPGSVLKRKVSYISARMQKFY